MYTFWIEGIECNCETATELKAANPRLKATWHNAKREATRLGRDNVRQVRSELADAHREYLAAIAK